MTPLATIPPEVGVPKLIELFRSSQVLEARTLANRLEEHGLHPTVVGSNLSFMVGAGTNAVPMRLLIPEAEEEDARAMMEIWEAMEKESHADDPKLCPACGAPWEPGFRECWSCQAPLNPT